MNKIKKIMTAGCLSLMLTNIGYGEEEDFINKTIENLSQHFVSGSIAQFHLEKENFVHTENRNRLIAPFLWGVCESSSLSLSSSQQNYLFNSFKILLTLACLCTLERRNDLERMIKHVNTLIDHLNFWTIARLSNKGLFNNIITLYHNATDKKKSEILEKVELSFQIRLI